MSTAPPPPKLEFLQDTNSIVQCLFELHVKHTIRLVFDKKFKILLSKSTTLTLLKVDGVRKAKEGYQNYLTDGGNKRTTFSHLRVSEKIDFGYFSFFICYNGCRISCDPLEHLVRELSSESGRCFGTGNSPDTKLQLISTARTNHRVHLTASRFSFILEIYRHAVAPRFTQFLVLHLFAVTVGR